MDFADTLRQFADDGRDTRLAHLAARLRAPVRVAVQGRHGVGTSTVAAALAGAGVSVTPDPELADVGVVVIAEVLKPEDRALLDALGRPGVVVLNKADACGFGSGGPMALARRRAAEYRARAGAPVVAMSALLADVTLDDELIGALRALVHAPADLSSADAFTSGLHLVSEPVRRRLITTLDRLGVVHAVVALADGGDAGSLAAQLRRLSGIDGVLEQLDAAAAPLRYRRLRRTITELCALAAQSDDDRLADLLRTDDTVLAVMTAAVRVVEAAGTRVDRGDDAPAHLRRAVHWRRYARGPVDSLHRACAADITRGSLRLLGRSR
ncbi:hypothetical protein [Mycobacterium sp. IDR2000157661]|uniref:hypothetical protein n=1 Tax=Mycobacterium sp. IDR2000157661 TaxID=2867005 RepID=UPI001EEC422F|nr:hypothetical protein [Mycobacterium sp. IDR2000157661]